ncbi:hypothetical protein K474DRAFT_1639613 [Panus rudis PR-1116 ss-1]|nr:hypothetical protein K474DRAFT_1639613 [Panus rudis PR-1116 ss-1]
MKRRPKPFPMRRRRVGASTSPRKAREVQSPMRVLSISSRASSPDEPQPSSRRARTPSHSPSPLSRRSTPGHGQGHGHGYDPGGFQLHDHQYDDNDLGFGQGFQYDYDDEDGLPQHQPDDYPNANMYDNDNEHDNDNYNGNEHVASEFDVPPASSSLPHSDHGHDDDDDDEDGVGSPRKSRRRLARTRSIISISNSSGGDSDANGDNSNANGRDSSPSSQELSKEDRKKLKILRRMLPGNLVDRFVEQARLGGGGGRRGRRAGENEGDEDDDDDEDEGERGVEDEDGDEDGEERPLQPGQTRIRKATRPVGIHEIRGDSESSDIEIPSTPSSLRRRSLSPGELSNLDPFPGMDLDLDNSSESGEDVGGYAVSRKRGGKRGYYINLISSSSEGEDSAEEGEPAEDGDDNAEEDGVESNEEEEIERWVTATSSSNPKPPRTRPGAGEDVEIREGDLIDRMLTRTRISGPRRSRPRRPPKKGKGKERQRQAKLTDSRWQSHSHSKAHPKGSGSGGKLHIVTGGVSRSGGKQPKLAFGRQSSSVGRQSGAGLPHHHRQPPSHRQPHSRTNSRSYSNSHLYLNGNGTRRGHAGEDGEEDMVIDLTQEEAGPSGQGQSHGPGNAKMTRKELKQARNAIGLYTINNASGKQITSGRFHQPFTIDAEEETYAGHSRELAMPNAGAGTSKSRLKGPKSRPRDMQLEEFWKRQAGEDAEPTHSPKKATTTHKGEEVLRHIVLDCNIPGFPSGIAFARNTYLGKGRLHELLSVHTAAPTITRPTPLIAFDFHVTSLASAESFLEVFEGINEKLVQSVSEASNSVSFDSLAQWRSSIPSISQHVSWYLSQHDAGDAHAIRNAVLRFLRKASQVVEEYYAVRSDNGSLNHLVFEMQWYAVELCWRAFGLDRDRAYTDPGSIVHHVKQLVRHLFAFGVDRPVGSVSMRGLDYSSRAQRTAEIWICLVHLCEHIKNTCALPATSPPIPSFWDYLCQAIQDVDWNHAAGGPARDVISCELLWRTILGLCSLSQFSPHGMTTSTPKLGACWQLVAIALQRVRLEANPELDAKLSESQLLKRDSYIRMLVSRCLLLHKRWQWRFDDASVMFHRLLDIFKSRRFGNLADEATDFPSFLRYNNLQLLFAQQPDDVAFTLFLKLVVWAAKEAPVGDQTAATAANPGKLSPTVRKILSLAVPVGGVSFTRATPPSPWELSLLYNRLSAIAVAIYLEPTPQNVENRLRQARRYVNFGDIGHRTRKTCLLGLKYLTILVREFNLPLVEVANWLAEMTNILIDEYRAALPTTHPVTAVGATGERSVKRYTVIAVQMLLGIVRQIIETPVMENGVEVRKYPEPALIDGPWVTRVFSTETDLATVHDTGSAIRKLVQAFLDARAAIIPKPPRPQLPIINKESQESQEDYGFDLNLDDPEILAALGEPAVNSNVVTDDVKAKEKRVAELIDLHISPAIYRLVCKHVHFSDRENAQKTLEQVDDADRWIDCWVGCASVLVQNGRRDWSLYFSLGPQSWERIIDSSWRRRVGLRFMLRLLDLDPTAYTPHQDRFLEVFIQCLVTARVTLEHRYVSLVLSIDGLRYPFFQGLPIERLNPARDFEVTISSFLEGRTSWLQHLFSRLSESIAGDANDLSRRQRNQLWLGFILTMISAMRDALESLAPETNEHAEYTQFCRIVTQTLISFPLVRYHPRFQNQNLLQWLDGLL